MRLPVAAVAVLVVVAACSGDDVDPPAEGARSDTTAALVIPDVQPADEGIEGVLAIKVASRRHVTDQVTYDRHPPAGGDHNPVPVKCGFYDKPVPDEFVVHSMEKGAVWLAYRAELPPADLEVIHNVARANPEVVATPYTDLPDGVAVVASAWGRQLGLPSANDQRLTAFVAAYQNGEQAPEPDVACANAPLGDPIP
jgi:hypothetical protein